MARNTCKMANSYLFHFHFETEFMWTKFDPPTPWSGQKWAFYILSTLCHGTPCGLSTDLKTPLITYIVIENEWIRRSTVFEVPDKKVVFFLRKGVLFVGYFEAAFLRIYRFRLTWPKHFFFLFCQIIRELAWLDSGWLIVKSWYLQPYLNMVMFCSW